MSFLLFIKIIHHNWNMSQDLRKILAANLKNIRTEQKIKREELSLALGFDNSYISKVEKGKVNITLDRIEKIANYLGVDASDLLI